MDGRTERIEQGEKQAEDGEKKARTWSISKWKMSNRDEKGGRDVLSVGETGEMRFPRKERTICWSICKEFFREEDIKRSRRKAHGGWQGHSLAGSLSFLILSSLSFIPPTTLSGLHQSTGSSEMPEATTSKQYVFTDVMSDSQHIGDLSAAMFGTFPSQLSLW